MKASKLIKINLIDITTILSIVLVDNRDFYGNLNFMYALEDEMILCL